MSSALTFILKLQDMLTPGMRQAAQISNTSAAQIESQFNRIAGGGKRMSASVDELRARLEAVNRVRFSTSIEREFNTATRSAQRLQREIDRLENKGQRGGGLTSLLGGLAAGYGAFSVGKMALGGAAEREQQNISFGVMTGSEKTGNKMVKDLVNMGAATPYESNDLIKNAQTLKAFGIENEKVLPILRTIGDVAGGSAEKLGSLSLAFAQASSAGKLGGQDLLQMVNAGFNPLQQMVKDKVFPSMKEARKAMEHGAIGANMMEAAFKSATGPGGQFYQMMDKQSMTLNGRYSTFMDNVKMKLMSLGNVMMPIASAALDFGSALLSGEGPALAIAAAIGGITLALTWNSIAAGISSGAMAVFNAVMAANPIILIITLLIALGLWLYSIAKKYEGWGKSLQGVWEIVKGFVKLNIIAWKDFGESIWYWVQYAFLKVKSFVEYVSGAMGNVWNAMKLASQFKFGEAKAALTAEIKTTATTQLAELEKQHNAGRLKNETEAQAALKQMQNGYGMIGLKKIAEPVKGTNPVTANAGGASGADFYKGLTGAAGDKSAKDKADSINGGGQRSIVINIAKVIDKIEQHIVGGGREVADEFASAVREALNRELKSLNGVAA